MNNEPVMTAEYVKSLAAAAVAIVVSFGLWKPTTDQIEAIFTAVAVLFPLAQFILVRSRVTPVAKLPALPPVVE